MNDIYKNIASSNNITIMGILNVTPDSFSDGGKYFLNIDAIDHGQRMIDEGADIIDIGGESTRPGAEKVPVQIELDRVIPVIEELVVRNPNSTISIDTSKALVAEEAIKAGARLINDISGGAFDSHILTVASDYEVPYVLMHIKGTPRDMQESPSYENVIHEILDYFKKKIRLLNSKNVNKIILDPGIGFGKSVIDNYEILNRLDEFNKLNYPLMIGVSKKSFLGKSLNKEVSERETPTIIAETIAVMNKAKIIRTHNVKNALELKKMMLFLNNQDMVLDV